MNDLYSQVERMALRHPSRELLVTDGGQRYTWTQLHEQTARYANALTDAGVRHADRVAVQVDKSVESLFVYLACLRAGFVYLPLNTAYQRAELSYFIGDAQPRAVVCRPQNHAEMAAMAAGATVFTMDEEGAGSLYDAAASCASTHTGAPMDGDTLATIIYTSGTTGRSKGAMITHRNLVSNARVLVDYWGFTERDVLLHALPIFHVHGLFVANHCALLSGARMIWHRKFDPVQVLRDLPRASVLMGVPTFYTRLLAERAFTRELSRDVRLFVSGSAPLLMETFTAFEQRTGQRILERYGMSEAGMITSNPLNGERKGGTVGLPLPGNQVRVASDEDVPLRTGEIGAIQIRGENVFRGYWNMPEKTREEFTLDGWFRTGDVGAFDAEGYLSIVGRAKDLIITGGYNVYPKEIELVLDALPGVAESAVFGVAHPDFGEAVTAVVVPRKGDSVSEPDLIAALKRELANYKVPKRVIVIDELPRNAMGKVQKNVLRERYAA